ncbi:hypothetical protein QTI66_38705 [Variovorax sp. J22R133]|uniref:hypothetical protein n=1 Tax=Variovorax brevis TaxID=3053503 RepID=UPI002575463E|nr:hypothetical protein [Variovorax sp. J22R133]MDM0118016.1 hypothetical protein [Variovorax sp. J22R133]
MIRYFFAVRDLHPLLLAGLPAHYDNPYLRASASGRAIGMVSGPLAAVVARCVAHEAPAGADGWAERGIRWSRMEQQGVA